jgi:hypothetical protein
MLISKNEDAGRRWLITPRRCSLPIRIVSVGWHDENNPVVWESFLNILAESSHFQYGFSLCRFVRRWRLLPFHNGIVSWCCSTDVEDAGAWLLTVWANAVQVPVSFCACHAHHCVATWDTCTVYIICLTGRTQLVNIDRLVFVGWIQWWWWHWLFCRYFLPKHSVDAIRVNRR